MKTKHNKPKGTESSTKGDIYNVYIRKQEISQTNSLTEQPREVEKEEKTTQR